MARILLGRVRSCEEDSASSLLPSVLGTDGLKLKRFKASGVLRVSLGTGRARLRHWGVGAVSYTHLTLPTIHVLCRSRWSPYH